MRLPRIRPQRAAQLLERHGFRAVRSSGSHRIYRDALSRRYVLPFHSRKELSPKAVKELLDLLGLTPADL
jgi:predicted RNA binding protein YcfA (HicA-like mRNA interferase family)